MAEMVVNMARVRELLGCSRSHVYRLVERGELRAIKVGDSRGLRVYLSSVESFKRRREIHPDEAA
ncbi:helix-turn-helix domain-containing protein [Desulfovibrio sulfodismutans]|uniref:Helix-turn-helix domain-containing protein n=1 Tax=Desulfolutivibrio sulfodismutans TaxID=63561 RepID=A0A7K3NKD3_9BACT|nr:helix-turn-helix domain-containing protein [Desulfolutivibrio sulfodismutans]NDY56668.1 helix-turn-helix domain-containing protein [Desulfolutivibrio sulfodismutans]QLA11232.1 helix-turn-helix domain-containing protein [Desulfolutivibrio sulfodismutans DSM 3696]